MCGASDDRAGHSSLTGVRKERRYWDLVVVRVGGVIRIAGWVAVEGDGAAAVGGTGATVFAAAGWGMGATATGTICAAGDGLATGWLWLSVAAVAAGGVPAEGAVAAGGAPSAAVAG